MDLNELIERASELPDGLQKVSILEDVVRHFDSVGDARRAFQYRFQLVEAASCAGLHERSLVAFVAYLNHFDRTPELQSHYHELIWAYFGIIWFTVDQPAISLQQVDKMVDDLRDRFSKLGFHPRPVDHLRWRLDMANGFLERASRLCESWSRSRETVLCYDRASQLDSVVELHFRCGRYREAIEAAQPIFKQNLRSGPVPGLTYCNVMMAHVLLREPELAREFADKLEVFLKRRNSLGYLYEVSFLFGYLVHSRNLTKAMKLFRRYVRWASETKDKDNINLFLNAAAELFRLMSSEKSHLKLRWSGPFPWCCDGDRYDLAELASQIENWVDLSAATFDHRNQNAVYSDRIKLFRSICRNGPES